MNTRLLALVASATLATASAAWAQAPAAEPQPAAKADAKADAKAETKSDAKAAASSVTIAPPPAGKGQIVFFRPGRLIGAAVGYKLLDDKTPMGKVSNGHYLVVTVEPGAHTFVMDFGTKGDIHMEIEPDETYYLECGIAMGAILNHPNLIPATPEDFQTFALKGKPQKK